MTQEDKELLFKDLCARLPYRTMVKCITDYHHEFDEELSDIHIMNFYQFDTKPYLRPMSSMTEEEEEEYESIKCWKNEWDLVDWLNAHHFDFRNFIEKGLALEAPEYMYK